MDRRLQLLPPPPTRTNKPAINPINRFDAIVIYGLRAVMIYYTILLPT